MGWGDILSGALQIGGALLSHNAEKKQVEAQKQEASGMLESAQMQADQLEQQAKDEEANADRTRLAAFMRAQKLEQAGRETAENAIGQYASSGVVAGEGSAAVVPASIVGNAAEDAWAVMYQANDEATQYKAQAQATRQQAANVLKAGNIQSSGALNAAKTNTVSTWANTLTTAGNMANNWLNK